jgi:hypothetical protein
MAVLKLNSPGRRRRVRGLGYGLLALEAKIEAAGFAPHVEKPDEISNGILRRLRAEQIIEYFDFQLCTIQLDISATRYR